MQTRGPFHGEQIAFSVPGGNRRATRPTEKGRDAHLDGDTIPVDLAAFLPPGLCRVWGLRATQYPVPERACGFDPHLRH